MTAAPWEALTWGGVEGCWDGALSVQTLAVACVLPRWTVHLAGGIAWHSATLLGIQAAGHRVGSVRRAGASASYSLCLIVKWK